MNIKTILSCAAVAATALLTTAEARAEWTDSIQYKAEVGFALSHGEHSPFWMTANKQGFSTIRRNSAYLRLGAFKHMDESKRFDWGAGIDMGVASAYQSTFMPQQLYAEIKYRSLDALLGAKELHDPIVDPQLSSGALTNSENAHPIPQLRLGIFDYAGFWGCDNWFWVKGYIAYGAYTDNWWIKRWVNPDTRYTLNTLYASRAIYFKGGDESRFPLTGELGLVVDSEWGGKTWEPDGKGGGVWQKHPTDFKALIKAMIPSHGGSDNSYGGEKNNVEGNMLGNWSFALKWTAPQGWSVKAYYQHFFEDHSMMFFDYPWKDGLYGVQAKLPKNRFVSDFVYEFLYMKDQAGSVYWDHTPDLDHQISGRDDYYNNYIYNGWQNWGMGIGNPLLLSPVYNSNHRMLFYNTRIVSHHFGLKGQPSPQVDWRMFATYTESWGTYSVPLDHTQSLFSMLAEVKYHPARLKGWEGTLQLAFDRGSLLGHNLGFALSISKTGFFK